MGLAISPQTIGSVCSAPPPRQWLIPDAPAVKKNRTDCNANSLLPQSTF